MPGSRLVNRLQDLGYRVQCLGNASQLVAQTQQEKPLVAIMDLNAKSHDPIGIIRSMKDDPATRHVPILAFAGDRQTQLQEAARLAGATLVASDSAFFEQLPQMLDQVLQVD